MDLTAIYWALLINQELILITNFFSFIWTQVLGKFW